MIQRIQSVYLVVVVVLWTVMLFTPMEMQYDGQSFGWNYETIFWEDGKVLEGNYLLTALEVIIPLMALITVFLYKNRPLQIRLIIINIVLMLGFYPLLAMYLYMASQLAMYFVFKIIVLFPLISAILSYLAIRAIKKDEALVRAVNRIR